MNTIDVTEQKSNLQSELKTTKQLKE